MDLSKKIRKRFGSIKRFCDEMGISYTGFRTAMSLGFLTKSYRDAVMKSGVVKDESEIYEMLYENTQAKRLAKLTKDEK